MAPDIEGWIDRCRAVLESTKGPPYLDRPYPELKEQPLEISHSAEALESYLQDADQILSTRSYDMGLRFALLYPVCRKSHAISCFREVAALCIPERITDLYAIQFELQNAYFTSNWGLSRQLLRRLEHLDLLPPAELAALKGFVLFLSVFGWRIQFEFDNEEEYDFYWIFTLPFTFSPEFSEAENRRLRESFAHPEILVPGSIPHWVITAWTTNPRAPKYVGVFPDELDFSRPDPARREARSAEERQVGYVLNMYRDFELLPSFSLTEEQRGRLVESKRNLQDALELAPQLGIPYRTLLARVLYSLGEFTEAGEEYERARLHRFRFQDPLDDAIVEDYEWELALMTAVSFKRAGNLDRAVSILEQPASSGNLLFGVSWWMAQWYSQEGQFDKAAASLIRESEGALSLPESWQLSTALALARLSRDDDQAERFGERLARSNPDFQKVVLGLSYQLWPLFARLSSKSQAHWLHGVAQLHGTVLFPDAEGVNANTAIKDFEWIVEHELHVRLFQPFREHVQIELLSTARKDAREWPTNKFFKFLASTVPEITLGAMVLALDQCCRSVIPTDLRFREYVTANCEGVLGRLEELKAIKQLRDPAVHPQTIFRKSDAIRLALTCRNFLDSLLLAPSSKVGP